VVADVIRPALGELFGQEVAQGVRVLYGGSVKGSNAGEFFAMPEIDGALVGGASLKAADFLQIVQAAQGE
jgi:triosephosphate isomerase